MFSSFLLSLCLSAHAEEALGTMDISYFRPPPDGYRYFNTPSATTLRHMQMGVSFWVSYENDPLVFLSGGQRVAPLVVQNEESENDIGDAAIDNRVMSNVQLSLGFFQFLSVSVDLPLIFWQSGYQLESLKYNGEKVDLISSGLGDMRLGLKAVIVDRDKLPFGLAFFVPIGTPTSSGGSLFGEEDYSFTPMGILEFSDAPVRSREYKFRGSFFGGYHFRPDDMLLNTSVGNQAVYGGALAFHPVSFAEILIDYTGRSGVDGTSGELLFGLKFLTSNAVEVNLGGGLGVQPGIGTTDMRGVFGVTVAPDFDPRFQDEDGDGIPKTLDKCPKAKEDFDGVLDEDGCPDYDRDGDGIDDSLDKCPSKKEDKDGFMDEDGCPDLDNDNDGIADVTDRCPLEPETFNRYLDEDGCPDSNLNKDSDGDGVRDGDDRCPFEEEDIDRYLDEDGCPDPDNDGDTILDYEDQCPDAREVVNRVDDEDGCPDESDRVRILKNKIVIGEKIFFDFSKALIKQQSYDLLDEIASLILAKPKLRIIRIVGHTDDIGSNASNQTLSEDRANAVRTALIERGVESHRLAAEGKGESQPLVPGTSDSARAKNRRVEFLIEYK